MREVVSEQIIIDAPRFVALNLDQIWTANTPPDRQQEVHHKLSAFTDSAADEMVVFIPTSTSEAHLRYVHLVLRYACAQDHTDY